MFIFEAFLAIACLQLFRSVHEIEACSAAAPSSNQEIEVINAVQELGRRISYAQWDDNPTSNVVLSPLSIAIILNLLILAAKGKANTQIIQALNYPNDLQECTIHEIFQEILSSLSLSGNEIEISVNTRLFPQQKFSILKSYTNASEIYYFTDVENLDYQNFPENATDTINNWVSESTNGRIEEVFSDPLPTTTVCVIVNTIFFNASWEHKFNPLNTRDGIFYTETKDITIPMMNLEINVLHIIDTTAGFEMIALPYVGNRFSLYILKPTDKSNTNLQEIEGNLNPSKLENLIDQMTNKYIEVIIPRMKLNFDLQLKNDLNDFGINEIFSDEADFSRFSEEDGLYISKIVHKAIIEVTEYGTVAAAVTAATVETTSVHIPPSEKFELNEPSLAFIRDNNKGLIVFYTRIMDPEPF